MNDSKAMTILKKALRRAGYKHVILHQDFDNYYLIIAISPITKVYTSGRSNKSFNHAMLDLVKKDHKVNTYGDK